MKDVLLTYTTFANSLIDIQVVLKKHKMVEWRDSSLDKVTKSKSKVVRMFEYVSTQLLNNSPRCAPFLLLVSLLFCNGGTSIVEYVIWGSACQSTQVFVVFAG